MLSEVVLVDSGLSKPSEEAPASLPGKRYPAGRLHLARCLADEHHTLTAPEDIGDLYVRGATGTMAPFTAFSTVAWHQGPMQLTRYNGQPSMEILGQAAPGVSSGGRGRPGG